MQSRRWVRFGSALALTLAAVVVGCERSAISSPEVSSATPGIHLMRSAAPAQRKVAVRLIGAEGGTIELEGRRLIVPAGAVGTPTLFKVTSSSDQYIRVELHATRGNQRGGNDDVGAQGFARSIMLEFSYDLAGKVLNPDRLAIAWVREDGTLVRLPSVVNRTARTVTAELEHFSGYALVSD